MKLTASYPVSERAIEEKKILDWVNEEARKLLQQLRTFANLRYCERQSAATPGDGAYVTIWTSAALPTNATWTIVANVSGINSSGATQNAGYLLRGCFRSASGTVSQVGATASDAFESAAACDARFTVDAANRVITVQVRDDAVSPMRWVAVVDQSEALPA